jgi:hypothetical protein
MADLKKGRTVIRKITGCIIRKKERTVSGVFVTYPVDSIDEYPGKITNAWRVQQLSRR